jgi:hypothetical protein
VENFDVELTRQSIAKFVNHVAFSEAVKNEIASLGSQRSRDAKTDTASGSGDERPPLFHHV